MGESSSIILYASAEHLNSMLVLSIFISKHHPSTSIIILSTAPESAASSVSHIPSVTYTCLPAAPVPANIAANPLDLLFEVPRLQNPILKDYLQEISAKTKIKAFVIDFFCNPAFEVAKAFDIPTYFYVSSGANGLCVFLYYPTLDKEIISPRNVADVNDYLFIPGCPPIHSIDIPKGMHIRTNTFCKHIMDTATNMRKSSGFLVNSFDALEYRAKEALKNGLCVPGGLTPPVFFIASLANSKKNAVVVEEERHECLKWLDTQPSKSVIFLCFGRRGLFSEKQLKEIAIGLEKSSCRFVWSVRNPPGKGNSDPDLESLLPEGFLERNKDKGFVIKTWAPQKEVLGHDSVGGFVTHCGRSSILEAVMFGVPMIAFPMYAEQRMNRVFMVEEMKLALPLDEVADGFVAAEEVEKRVRELMETTKGRDVRERVAEYKVAGEKAVEEGGSSVVALEEFVKLVMN